jgi:phosphoserine phosphatase RsbU/P
VNMGSPKLLIVDDEPFNIDYLEQELEELACDLISASDGIQALEKVRSESPDLVLLDIMMPGMDGFEVLARLKADPSTRDIPVIVISASSSMQSAVRGIQLGAEDYLPKPFEPTLLKARISSSLEKKRLRDLQQLYLKSLERELDIGREIQRGFLPAALPQTSEWETAAYFKAAREVAGDFYDAFELPTGELLCVIGDVCGKGVGAALFMTLFRSLIRATSTSNDFLNLPGGLCCSPSERLEHAITFTNTYISETHDEAGMFATIFIGILGLEDGRLTYINCGNEPPLLIKQDGEIQALGPTGPVVGVIPGASFAVKEALLEKGEILVAFTDGVPDAMNAGGISFGRERLVPLLQLPHAGSAALIGCIEEHLRQFTGAADPFDDITLLAVHRLE